MITIGILLTIILCAYTTYALVWNHIQKGIQKIIPYRHIYFGAVLLTTFWIVTFIVQCFYFIKPGEVGVTVNMFGSKQGVEDNELNVGMHFITPWKKVYLFPIYEQNHQWTDDEKFSFQTEEGLSVQAEIGINFRLVPNRVHDLFCKYRSGMEEITHLFIRNNIRDAINRTASRMKIEELYGPKKEFFFQEVLLLVKKDLEPLGFDISHLYIIGRFEVPLNVMESLNKKIEATQRAQQRENELREAEAEAKKCIAKADGEAKTTLISAKAQADATLYAARAQAESNNLITKSLTLELIQYHAVNKWDGVTPTIMSGSGMIFNLPIKKD